MNTGRKPWWQQATALVTVTTGGAIAGLTFVPGTAAAVTSPSSVPLHLLALDQAGSGNVRSGGPDAPGSPAADAALRSAIVNVAEYYRRVAQNRTPGQMEALIWDNTSLNEADHGESCAAFASLTLELGAQVVGQRSWVTGGSTYPWPLADWADVRVNPNPASPAITSIVTDAQAHGRWHPLGHDYSPRPGDWAVFNGHVEVVTGYADGTLDTIGADSLPGLTVNAHAFDGPLGEAGVQGFVDNGSLRAAGPVTTEKDNTNTGTRTESVGDARIPGIVAPTLTPKPTMTATQAGKPSAKPASKPSAPASKPSAKPAANLADKPAHQRARRAAAKPADEQRYREYTPPQPAAAPGTRAQQEFINAIAPGAIAAQQRYGVPAAVTIAQAIEESAWGHSSLAAVDHNLFGIKGTGPAGSVSLPTSEYLNGQWVTIDAGFRVYHNVAESIADHAELLATSGYYTRAMADRTVPDAFANDLTGVYATDPDYGANLIALMRLYNLYRFDTPVTPTPATHTQATHATPAHATPAHATPTHVKPAHATPTHVKPAHAPAAGTAPAVHVTAPSHPAAFRPAPDGPPTAIPGVATPRLTPARPAAGQIPAAASATGSGASIPGTVSPGSFGLTGFTRTTPAASTAATAATPLIRYKAQLPTAVTTAYFAAAKGPLTCGEPLYREFAGHAGLPWELLAACDWMQCKAHPRYSPVHGEKIGTLNADDTVYRTKSQALTECAGDLIALTAAVYRIDLTARRPLSVRALADAFAAFRWGELLRRHGVSSLEFPYSVAGLTEQHQKMQWPAIDEPSAPDRPGARFRQPFGAVPVVLSLGYPATVLAEKSGRACRKARVMAHNRTLDPVRSACAQRRAAARACRSPAAFPFPAPPSGSAAGGTVYSPITTPVTCWWTGRASRRLTVLRSTSPLCGLTSNQRAARRPRSHRTPSHSVPGSGHASSANLKAAAAWSLLPGGRTARSPRSTSGPGRAPVACGGVRTGGDKLSHAPSRRIPDAASSAALPSRRNREDRDYRSDRQRGAGSLRRGHQEGPRGNGPGAGPSRCP